MRHDRPMRRASRDLALSFRSRSTPICESPIEHASETVDHTVESHGRDLPEEKRSEEKRREEKRSEEKRHRFARASSNYVLRGTEQ